MSNDIAHLTGQDLQDIIALVGAAEERPSMSDKMRALRRKLETLALGAPIGIAPLQANTEPLAVDLTTAAKLVSMSPAKLRVELEEGSLPGFLAAGTRQWRIRLLALHEYMKRMERRAQGDGPVIVSGRNEFGKFNGPSAPLFTADGN